MPVYALKFHARGSFRVRISGSIYRYQFSIIIIAVDRRSTIVTNTFPKWPSSASASTM